MLLRKKKKKEKKKRKEKIEKEERKEMEGGGGVKKMWRSVFAFRGKVIERGMNPQWEKPLSAGRFVWRRGKKKKEKNRKKKEERNVPAALRLR